MLAASIWLSYLIWVFDSTIEYPTKNWSGIQKRAMTMIAYKILKDCFWSKIALWEWNPI